MERRLRNHFKEYSVGFLSDAGTVMEIFRSQRMGLVRVGPGAKLYFGRNNGEWVYEGVSWVQQAFYMVSVLDYGERRGRLRAQSCAAE